MFGRGRWPQVQLEDADLFANLLDAIFIAAPRDAAPPLRELARLAGPGLDQADRSLWQWCAAWSQACDQLDEHLLAAKIAVFAVSWRDTPIAPAAVIQHLGVPSTDDFAAIRDAALIAVAELDDSAVVRKPDGLTAARVGDCLREGLPLPTLERSPVTGIAPAIDTLDQQRHILIERRCSLHWGTMTDFLLPGEVVRAACPVTLPNLRLALLALTDDRILIARGNALGFGEPTFMQIDLLHVLTARYTTGKFRDADGFKEAVHKSYELVIESRTGTFSVSFGVRGTPKNEGGLWPNLILEHRDRKAGALNSPPPVAAGGLATDLEKIATLHREGLLSEGEYQAAKSRILNLDT